MATESSSSSSKSNSGLSRINCKKTERDQNRVTELQQSSTQACIQPNGWANPSQLKWHLIYWVRKCKFNHYSSEKGAMNQKMQNTENGNLLNNRKKTNNQIYFVQHYFYRKITYLKGLVQVSPCLLKSYLSSSLWVAHTFQGIDVLQSPPPFSSLLPPDLCLFLQEHRHCKLTVHGKALTHSLCMKGFLDFFASSLNLLRKRLFFFVNTDCAARHSFLNKAAFPWASPVATLPLCRSDLVPSQLFQALCGKWQTHLADGPTDKTCQGQTVRTGQGASEFCSVFPQPVGFSVHTSLSEV